MKIVLASNNVHKIKEINVVFEGKTEVISLSDVGITEDIPEPFDTFDANALAKAQYVFDKTGILTFSEDSGLVVPALNGAPGVFSARYAGEPKSDAKNTAKLLENMQNISDRTAYYQTVICLVGLATPYYFKGQCHGSIATELSGNGGFGYDPIFIPEGYHQTFGALPTSVKYEISHRTKAVALFTAFLNEKLESLNK